MQNSGNNNQKHRSNNTTNSKAPTRQYYTAQGKFCIKYVRYTLLSTPFVGNNLSAQNEKSEDAKLAGNTTPSTTNSNIATSVSNATKTSIGNVSTAGVNPTEKENIAKEEAVSLKE